MGVGLMELEKVDEKKLGGKQEKMLKEKASFGS